jgi:hypothetical protein
VDEITPMNFDRKRVLTSLAFGLSVGFTAIPVVVFYPDYVADQLKSDLLPMRTELYLLSAVLGFVISYKIHPFMRSELSKRTDWNILAQGIISGIVIFTLTSALVPLPFLIIQPMFFHPLVWAVIIRMGGLIVANTGHISVISGAIFGAIITWYVQSHFD